MSHVPDMDAIDMSAKFDSLSKFIDGLRDDCARYYDKWQASCDALKDAERQRSQLFRKMAGPR